MKEQIYCYAKPNAMVDHKFTDDVAICMASSTEEAIDKFKQLYDDITEKDVFPCAMNNKWGVAILTSY